MRATHSAIEAHVEELKSCSKCPLMVGPVVTGRPELSKVYLIGQAPGPREGDFGRPFAWTAGKMLFRWFESLGINEEQFRSLCYMAAVCRCFPGKTKQGGDRVPTPGEVAECSFWMKREIAILKPQLIIPVGRLAIEQVLDPAPLVDSVGKKFTKDFFGQRCDVIPLPHPSGASTWFKKEPGKSLLSDALSLIDAHPIWQEIKSAAK